MATLQDVIHLVNGKNVLYSNLVRLVHQPVSGDKLTIGERTYTFGSDIPLGETLGQTLSNTKKAIKEVYSIVDNVLVLTSTEPLTVSAVSPGRKGSILLRLQKNFLTGDVVSVAGVPFRFGVVDPFGENIPADLVPIFENVEATLESFVKTVTRYQSTVSGKLINDITINFSDNGIMIAAKEEGYKGNNIPFVYGTFTFVTKNGADPDRIEVYKDIMEEDGAGELAPVIDDIVSERQIFEDGIGLLETITCMIFEQSTSPKDDWSGARRDRRYLKDRIKKILEVIPSSAHDDHDDRKDVSNRMKSRL